MAKNLLALLQVGLGVQLHHHFSSHFLVNTFNTPAALVMKYTDLNKMLFEQI